MRSNPALVARHTVVVVLIWDERLCTDGLFTTMTHKTVLMPRGATIFQHPRPWHYCLVTGHALGGKFIAVAVATHKAVVLAGEGLICQRTIAAETSEAVLVVVSVLIEELLGIVTYDFFAFLTGVGIQAVVTRNAVGIVLHLDVFAPVQGLVAVLTVKPVTHYVLLWLASFPCASAAC